MEIIKEKTKPETSPKPDLSTIKANKFEDDTLSKIHEKPENTTGANTNKNKKVSIGNNQNKSTISNSVAANGSNQNRDR